MNRRIILAIAFLVIARLSAFCEEPSAAPTQFYLYVGAYTDNAEEGIAIYQFDAIKGDLKYVSTAKNIKNPSYLAINKKKDLLVAVNEIGEYNGEKAGSVTSFRINADNGHLQKINQVSSGGGSPCYISLNKSGSHAFVANYSGGNVAMIPIESNGRLLEYSDLVQHAGSGVVEGRQKGPHAHAIVLDPRQEFAIGVDLGIDKVITYAIHEKQGTLTSKNEFTLTPGAGPRHLSFHPNKKFAYVISELNSTITSMSYDAKEGVFAEGVTVSTLPADYKETSYCADIHVSPDGKFLYGSNRGHNSIVVYSIDSRTGALEYVEHTLVRGDWPRNFMIDPTGNFLLVANQRSDNIVVFKIDKSTGKLRSNGVEVQSYKPVCLKMFAIR